MSEREDLVWAAVFGAEWRKGYGTEYETVASPQARTSRAQRIANLAVEDLCKFGLVGVRVAWKSLRQVWGHGICRGQHPMGVECLRVTEKTDLGGQDGCFSADKIVRWEERKHGRWTGPVE